MTYLLGSITDWNSRWPRPNSLSFHPSFPLNCTLSMLADNVIFPLASYLTPHSPSLQIFSDTKSCHFFLCNNTRMRTFISVALVKSLVCVLVIFHLGYCNILQVLSLSHLSFFISTQKSAGKIINISQCSDLVMLLFILFHWLSVHYHIPYKNPLFWFSKPPMVLFPLFLLPHFLMTHAPVQTSPIPLGEYAFLIGLPSILELCPPTCT